MYKVVHLLWRCQCGTTCDMRDYKCMYRDVRDGKLHRYNGFISDGTLDELRERIAASNKQCFEVTGMKDFVFTLMLVEGEGS